MHSRLVDSGLLVMRLVVGAMFVGHGWPKLSGGPETWEKLGQAMSHLGINFAPTFFGASAAIAETFGGALIALGLAFRPSAISLFATMVVAAAMHLGSGDSLMDASHAIEAAAVFLGLALIGPGNYALRLRIGR
jgi:putative oxidoreductase